MTMSILQNQLEVENCPAAAKTVAHDFGQGQRKPAEQRTLIVAVLTLVTMAVEIIAGWITGSMALLADGVHMAGHAAALGLAAGAYYLTRRHADDRRLSLGSGKMGDLAAYSSALLLGLSTLWLIGESVHRLFAPEPLLPAEALVVAVIGLVVNGVSIWLLGDHHGQLHEHGEAGEGCHHNHHHEHHGHVDNNLRAAVAHVIADVLTSVGAIVGLLAAWVWGWHWLDPVIALVASVVIMRWAIGLLRQTMGTLLDQEGPTSLRAQVKQRLESIPDSRIIDLHIWSVGQAAWTLTASIVTHHSHSPDDYKKVLHGIDGLHHPVVEINCCRHCRTDQSDP